MARVYVEFEDLNPDKQQEIIEAYEQEDVDLDDVNELFYCQFDVDEDGNASYE